MKKFAVLITAFLLIFSLVVYSAQDTDSSVTEPIKIVVSHPAGSDADSIARMIAGTAVNHFSQSITVVNSEYTAESNPYTVVMTSTLSSDLKPILQINVTDTKLKKQLSFYLAVQKDSPEEVTKALQENFTRTIQEETFKDLMSQSAFEISL